MQKHELKITMEIRATPASVADNGKVRLGGESPSFGRSDATTSVMNTVPSVMISARVRVMVAISLGLPIEIPGLRIRKPGTSQLSGGMVN